jgi:hypothetical protein
MADKNETDNLKYDKLGAVLAVGDIVVFVEPGETKTIGFGRIFKFTPKGITIDNILSKGWGSSRLNRPAHEVVVYPLDAAVKESINKLPLDMIKSMFVGER